MNRARILVSGKVQGVNFRFHVYNQAMQLGLKGYVKNLSNGKVEILVEGEKIEELVNFCKSSPGSSEVEQVDVNEEEFEEEFRNFSIAG